MSRSFWATIPRSRTARRNSSYLLSATVGAYLTCRVTETLQHIRPSRATLLRHRTGDLVFREPEQLHAHLGVSEPRDLRQHLGSSVCRRCARDVHGVAPLRPHRQVL